jgi:hypothetical protein
MKKNISACTVDLQITLHDVLAAEKYIVKTVLTHILPSQEDIVNPSSRAKLQLFLRELTKSTLMIAEERLGISDWYCWTMDVTSVPNTQENSRKSSSKMAEK